MQRVFKSQEVPEINEGSLTVLVGKNFREIVEDPTKDVIVEFYSPTCGHCEMFAPTWQSVAEHCQDVTDLIVANFDATANEVKGLKMDKFPSIRFYPKNNKEGVEYNGPSQFEHLIEFLSYHSSAYKMMISAPKSEKKFKTPNRDEF